MGNEREPIPFARPFIGAEEEAAVLRVLRSGWLTTGGEALAFEKEFAEFLGSTAEHPLYCMAVNSATSGLHLALEAAGVQAGDAVLVPSYTFTATAEVVRYLGADPVFVDVVPGGFHLDPAALEETLKRLGAGNDPYTGKESHRYGKPTAVIPVHFGGLCCNMAAIMDIAQRYNLKVIEDTAHAFPAATEVGTAGTIGDVGVFSFYANKTITTGEGGMAVCRDKALARRIALMRAHGIDRNAWARYTDTKASWYYEVVEAGYKYNMPDLLAAVGRAQLCRARELLQMRTDIAATYDAAFAGDEHFTIPPTANGNAHHLYPLRLNLKKLSIARNDFILKMQEKGIGISVHYIPLHTMPFYQHRYTIDPATLPCSLDAFERTISLPIWPGMTNAQVERVISVVKETAHRYTG